LKILYIVLGLVGLLVLVVPAGHYYYEKIVNPKAAQELRDDPTGERAQKVMLLTLPSGRQLPVNYLREDGRVYAASDGRWWKELAGGSFDVEVFVMGETLAGRARVVEDDPDYVADVFSRLRPTALPGTGRMIEILLDPNDPGGPAR